MNSLAFATGQPSHVPIAGRTYAVGPLKMRTIGRVQEWLDAQPYADPVAELRTLKEDLDPDVYRAEMMDAWARQRAGKHLVMGGGLDLINRSEAGRRVLFTAALREHQPGATDQEIEDAYGDCTPQQVMWIFLTALGIPTEAMDPKAAEPAANGVAG